MRLVRATNASEKLKVKIKELGRIAREGEVFQVTEERYVILAGQNRFKAVFVSGVPVTNVTKVVNKPEVKVTPEKKQTIKQVDNQKVNLPKNEKVDAKIDTQIVDEQPDEIWIIEPGKGKVRVDENLQPIIEQEEEKVDSPPPKKKRGRPKKTTIENTENN